MCAITGKRLARWFLINLFVAAVLCAIDRPLPGPLALGLCRNRRRHRALPRASISTTTWRKNDSTRPSQAPIACPLTSRPHSSPWPTSSSPAWTCAGSSATSRMACECWGLSVWRSRSASSLRAMMVNRFFSAVNRIQKDCGHHVIDQGVSRHRPASGLRRDDPRRCRSAVSRSDPGWALRFRLCEYSLMMLRRVLFEDVYLRSHLAGEPPYAARVRYRLIPGVRRRRAGGETAALRRSSRRRA